MLIVVVSCRMVMVMKGRPFDFALVILWCGVVIFHLYLVGSISVRSCWMACWIM